MTQSQMRQAIARYVASGKPVTQCPAMWAQGSKPRALLSLRVVL